MNRIEDITTYMKEHKSYFWYVSFTEGIKGIHSKFKNPKHEVNAAILLSIESAKDLCLLLKTYITEFESIINDPKYIQFKIGKKKGGKREISAPSKRLKQLQRHLNYFLQGYYLYAKPTGVYGFVINPTYLGKTCNIAENARNHVGKKYVLNIDLKDFFDSISAKQVKALFTSASFGFTDEIATALTLLTTYKGRLPQGAPTSPVISNFICMSLDADLHKFATENYLTYTRYADDLTFSSETKIESDTILDIINLIHKNRFKINERKLHQHSKNSKQTVTGVVVNEKVNVDRKFIKKTRAMLHDMIKNGVDIATRNHLKIEAELDEKQRSLFIHRLEGNIHFIGQVRGKNDFLYGHFKIQFDNFFKSQLQFSDNNVDE
jgi:RNA-directed DNA polymerase